MNHLEKKWKRLAAEGERSGGSGAPGEIDAKKAGDALGRAEVIDVSHAMSWDFFHHSSRIRLRLRLSLRFIPPTSRHLR